MGSMVLFTHNVKSFLKMPNTKKVTLTVNFPEFSVTFVLKFVKILNSLSETYSGGMKRGRSPPFL